MFTITPSPVSVSRVLGSTLERLSGNLFQRLPLRDIGDGLPMSCAHWSGTTGSTTIFVVGGTLATIQSRAMLRVSSRDRTRPECSE